MAIEGSLQDVSLADICQLVAMGRKTGCLSVTDRSNFGYVYFRDGRIIFASVLNRPDRLGELLVRNDVISRAELSGAMEAQAHRKGARLGQILIEQGSLNEQQLQRYISLQIEEAVYHLFAWSQGSFHFDPDQRPDEEGLFLVDIPAESLLLEGARRVDEWGLIEKKIPSMDLVYAVEKDPSQEADVALTQEQQRLLPLIDGTRTVDDLVHESGMVEFDTAKALYGLIQAGFVARAGQRSRAEGPQDSPLNRHLTLGMAFYRSGMLEDAARELQGALEIEAKHPRALFRLGLVAMRGGRPQEAIDWFDRIPEGARSSVAVQRNRALALESLARFDEALAALDAAEAARPGDAHVALARGIALLRTGDAGGAMEAFRRYRTSADVRKPAAPYYAYVALAAAVAGDLDYAVQVGREGLAHYPECGPLLVNAGAVLERKGELEAAEALFVRASNAPSAPPQAHKNLGDQAYARGDQERARSHYEKAVKIEPRLGDDIYMRLGTIAYKDDDLDVARLLWRRALELNPANEAVRANLELLSS